MSGGFFRGTSAEQDTRFSNKQAKLLKSQKFASELDQLVDMTKVKMDVMRPWIASRVTELLGFEDEVLINFIYGLLDGKDVNGKEVQISLTGFMERNTGKFMKELWTLLLSAQKNASGVPQQFLDAKEEETRKKKSESDRIVNELQRKKEKESRELEQEKLKRMDGGVENLKAANAVLEPISKQMLPRDSSTHSEAERDSSERNGLRGRNRHSRSPNSADQSPSPRGKPRSISRSFSNSRSYSGERCKSKSISGSPQPRGRSVSSEKVYRSPRRRSVSPRRRQSPRVSLSPRRRSFHPRRRSTSRSRRRSPSLRRRLRSPVRRRSPSPVRRRSPSPMQRRSPLVRRRSPSPVWRRSPPPVRYRSPSPVWRRSPSFVGHKSPSPVRRQHRRLSSTQRRKSPSPVRRRSPIYARRRSPSPSRRRSPSPYDWSSPSSIPHRSLSPVRRKSPKHQRRSPLPSPRERLRTREEFSPVPHAPPRGKVDPIEMRKGSDLMARRSPISLRSPQRDSKDRRHSHKKVPVLSPSPHGSRERKYHHDTPETSGETNLSREDGELRAKMLQNPSMHSSAAAKQKVPPVKVYYKEEHSPERRVGHRATETQSPHDNTELKKKDQDIRSEKVSRRVGHSDISDPQKSPISHRDTSSGDRRKLSYSGEGYKTNEHNRSHPNNMNYNDQRYKSETVAKAAELVHKKNQNFDSISEESDRHRAEVKEKKKHKRSDRKEVTSDDDDSYDSERAERKEAKRRRKEEKRLRKEEKRRRREDRRRRREERRAEKLKLKSGDANSPPSNFRKNQNVGYTSDGERVARRDYHSSDFEGTESEQKRLEIELRKKALESLRAKKGINH